MQLKSALKGTALLLWLACSLFFVCILLLPMRGIAAELAGQWFWQTEEGVEAGEPWRPFDFPQNPPVESDTQQVWLKTNLPQDMPRDASLLIQSRDQAFEVWLGDSCIYTYGEMRPAFMSYGQRWHIVSIPDGSGGRELRIHAYSASDATLGYFGQIWLDGNVEQVLRIFRQDVPYLMNIPLAVFMLVMMMIYATSPAAPKRLYNSFIAFITVFIIWMICATNSKQYVLDAPLFWRFSMQMSEYLLPLLANIVIFQVVDRSYKKMVRWTVLIYAVLLFITVGAEFLGFNGMSRGRVLLYTCLPLLEMAALYAIARSAHQGNMYARAVSVPLLFMAGAGTLDGISLYRHWYVVDGYLLPYTTFSLCVFVAFIMRHQIKRERMLMNREAGLKQEVSQAIEKATMDNLTKCYNRNKLEIVLATEILQHKNEEEPFSVIMLDIDFFKTVNDTYGHEVGDEVLAGFAEVIRHNIKKKDVLVRWGGEEFIILFRHCTGEEAMMIAERLRQKVESTPLYDGKIRITCSLGVASWHGADDSETQLLKRVDDALYMAKRTGRNRVCREPKSNLHWFKNLYSDEETE
ncbi:GGDEF domain-containing protein [Selenomonas ruminantium]|uniref:Diguanylate cyclase (GGDEF) domain-containing protein n=1 Tax=Selenomonas ruminantium TaxID=971 RepID=A0A1K1N2C4_SELRU|nr:GGDEF domain-containing protein [Selenomonas ruminantium]SFW29586.1 diguanylate cyclase (GGDEF) domain-containing protein [Selenomonas ruminantium]